MRLLSFLHLVETALRADGMTFSPKQVTRHVNYEAGLARMLLPDGVSLMVQNYHVAEDQLCLKAWWQEAGDEQIGLQTFFDTNGVDWKAAARQMAAGKPGEPILSDDAMANEAAAATHEDPLDTSDLIGGFRSAV